jgi:Helix-turn-helix domain
MDRQTLRDWVHRFNAAGPEGLIDKWTEGPRLRLSVEHWAEFSAISRLGQAIERGALVALPTEDWEFAGRRHARVNLDYHIDSLTFFIQSGAR